MLYYSRYNIPKQKIFELNCELQAIGCDNSPEALDKGKSRVFVLDQNNKIWHLEDQDRGLFNCIETYFESFQHKSEKSSWNILHLEKGARTCGTKYYQENKNGSSFEIDLVDLIKSKSPDL